MQAGSRNVKTVRIIGGLRAGTANATWPLASLTATHDRLRFEAAGIPEIELRSDQVLGFKRRLSGYQVYHTEHTPIPLVFWVSRRRFERALADVGFIPSATGSPDRFHDVAVQGVHITAILLAVCFAIIALLGWLSEGSRTLPPADTQLGAHP
jgi:hypothetical protein